MRGSRRNGERLGEMRGGTQPSRAQRGKSGPFFREFRIGGKASNLALPKRDPVFRKSVEIFGPSHQQGL